MINVVVPHYYNNNHHNIMMDKLAPTETSIGNKKYWKFVIGAIIRKPTIIAIIVITDSRESVPKQNSLLVLHGR